MQIHSQSSRYVTTVDYDAQGRRTLIQYGNALRYLLLRSTDDEPHKFEDIYCKRYRPR